MAYIKRKRTHFLNHVTVSDSEPFLSGLVYNVGSQNTK